MEKGDIILIPFPFTDLSGNKKKASARVSQRRNGYDRCILSTQIKWKEETDILLKPTKKNGLKKESFIRLSKLATIDKDIALGLIGRVDKDLIHSINKNLKKIFKLEG